MININKIERLDTKYKKLGGVYLIYSKNTGGIYIGSSSNLYKRYKEHRNTIFNKKHWNYKIKKIIHFFKDDLYFIIWELCSKENLIKREQAYIDLVKHKSILLNIRLKADSCLGVKRSDETKKRISKSKKGKSNNHKKDCKCPFCRHDGKYNNNYKGGITSKIYTCIKCPKQILKTTWEKGSKMCYICFRENTIPWNKGLKK